jgi:hypothetical protein
MGNLWKIYGKPVGICGNLWILWYFYGNRWLKVKTMKIYGMWHDVAIYGDL